MSQVCDMINYNNRIFICGGFSQAGNKIVNGLAKWDGNNWNNFGKGLKVQDGGQGLGLGFKIIKNELYVFGAFDSIDGVLCNSLAKFNGTTWIPVNDFPLFTTLPNTVNFVNDVEIYKNEIYVCGNFDNYPLNTILDITKWDGNTWTNVGNGIQGAFAELSNMLVYKNELIVAGRFSKTDSPNNPGENIGKWDGSQWTELGSGTDEAIWDIKVHKDTLYASGVFKHAGGIPADGIARWDGANWCGYGTVFDNVVSTLDFYHDTLYIGGGFWTINGDSIPYFAKWTGGNFVAACGTDGITPIENLQKLITIYPNPATNTLYTNGLTGINTVEVYDISGKLLLSKQLNSNQIDISSLAKGLYFIKLTTEEGSVVRKFVKE